MINTGFKELDKLITGFKNSELIFIASRPSIGKTALGLNLALNAAVKQRECHFRNALAQFLLFFCA